MAYQCPQYMQWLLVVLSSSKDILPKNINGFRLFQSIHTNVLVEPEALKYEALTCTVVQRLTQESFKMQGPAASRLILSCPTVFSPSGAPYEIAF
jgi:hypothetical protein